jgi:hypothetical protein
MSNQTEQADSRPLPPESQHDRWIKYGSNVALSIILVVALAVGLTWFAQRASGRIDMTKGGSLSLKPQTVAVLKDLKQKITLVSLYVRPDDKPDEVAQAQRVSDLLDEYKGKSSDIEVKVIDPAKEKDKLEDLHQEFITRYGSQIKSYRDYLDNWTKDFDQIKKLTDAEGAAISKFASTPGAAQDEDSPVAGFVNTITNELPETLADARKAVDHELKQKHPDYKAAANTAKQQMELVAKLAGAIVQSAPSAQTAQGLPPDFKKYLADSVPHYAEIKKLADDSIARESKLGELKVDQLEQALAVEDPILVLGADEWRIISKAQVWQDDTDFRQVNATAKAVPRFAGEQQVTSAIYGLANPVKKKICFVRASGEPMTQHGFPPFIPNGAMSVLAERLREYNFDVTEKDLSGQWAMQAQMRQMPSAPEPSDEQIKDALWVVLDLPSNEQQNPQAPPPPKIAPRLKDHLDHGGSALILADIHGDNMPEVLKDWGITLHTEDVGIHETVKVDEAADADPLEQAKAKAFIWDIRDYGDHPLASPIKNLDALIVAPIVVNTTSAKDCTVTPLLPLTMGGLKTWGTSDLENVDKGSPEYHADKGDLAPPIFAGAVSEKSGGGRLVVIGSFRSMTDGFMHIYDPRLARRDPPIKVNRSPGNSELFTNSIFWLAHLEPMIAISPAAMDVPRIDDMSKGMLTFWRVGVLMILLPGVVLAAGAFVYMSRRD